MFLKNSLRNLDMFGARVELFFSKESTYKTPFGGFLTILVWTFFLMMISPKLKNFVMRAEVNAVEKVRYSPSEGSISLGKEGLMLAFGFSNPSYNNYLNFTLIGRRNIRNSTSGAITKIKTEISVEKCTVDHFPGLEAAYKEMNLDGFVCPSLNQSWALSGTYTDDIFKFLQIKVSECKNIDRCKDRSEFFAKHPQLDFNLFLTSHDNNPRDNDKPLVKKITSELHFLLDNKEINLLYKEADIFVRTMKISFDREILLPVADNKVFNGIMYNNEIREQISASTNNGELANFYLGKSPYVVCRPYIDLSRFNIFLNKEVRREFYTFGEFFSFYGGAWSQLFFIFYFFGMHFNKRQYMNKLANKIYNFKEDEEESGRSNSSAASSKFKKDNSTPLRQKSLKEVLLGLHEFFIKGKYLNTSLLETFFGFLCKRFCSKKDKKLELLEASYTCISEDLDLLRIMKAVQDLERMKKLILTNDQQLLFEFFPNPIIKFNKAKRRAEKELSHTQGRISRVAASCDKPKRKIQTAKPTERMSYPNSKLDFTDPDLYKQMFKVYFLKKKKISERRLTEEGVEFYDNYLVRKLENEIDVIGQLRDLPDEDMEKLLREDEAGGDELFIRIQPLTKNLSNNEKEITRLEKSPFDQQIDSTGSFRTIK